MNKDLLAAYQWIDLGRQKNPCMWSFKHEEKPLRMNIYHTTGTITIQDTQRGTMQVHREVDTDEKLETILLAL